MGWPNALLSHSLHDIYSSNFPPFSDATGPYRNLPFCLYHGHGIGNINSSAKFADFGNFFSFQDSNCPCDSAVPKRTILIEAQKKQLIDVSKELQKILWHKNQELGKNKNKLNDHSFMNSHVLRAPIAKILSIVYLLEDNEEESEQRRLLKIIKKDAEEVDEVIKKLNDILTRRK